ncbi:hypothetical protein T265_15455, partial [Opisthorchis viverrini]
MREHMDDRLPLEYIWLEILRNHPVYRLGCLAEVDVTDGRLTSCSRARCPNSLLNTRERVFTNSVKPLDVGPRTLADMLSATLAPLCCNGEGRESTLLSTTPTHCHAIEQNPRQNVFKQKKELKMRTLDQQYEEVKKRTECSHVMKYGVMPVVVDRQSPSRTHLFSLTRRLMEATTEEGHEFVQRKLNRALQ